ncbi:MAG: LPS assembly protein LptD [Magnetospirillum sp.]|nr:LPS assembly protein LptD [Magnetospirillum sp.]
MFRKHAFLIGFFGWLAAAAWPGAPGHAQDRRLRPELPVMLTADELVADEDLGIVTTQGNVEVSQGDRILRANTLTFNRRTNVVTASGGVSLVEPGGDVFFAEFVELTSDLRDGVMRDLRLLLADQSRFAAVTARRADGSRTTMRRATYSPCEPCADNPTRAPMWQIRAANVRHDEARKEIVYDEAWLEIRGVPVAYTPYLAHPDGTEKRKSGFLPPDVASSSRTGTMVATPYYWTLGPSADATVTPIILSNDRPLMSAEYRQRFGAGQVVTDASFLNTRRDGEGFPQWRGHLRSDGRFDLDDNWRTGFDIARASDKTYIDRYRIRQRFRFIEQDALTSRGFVEGFQDRGYAVVNAFAFQGLRPEDDPTRTPLVLPAAAYSWVGEPGRAGGRFNVDASAVSIYRDRDVRAQRGTILAGWALPHTTRSGEIYTLTANLQSDVFHSSNTAYGTRDAFQPSENGVNARALPQIGLSWRLPLVRRDGSLRTIVEPMTAVYIAPNAGSQRDLPNEDSRGLTFDDTNLFRINRFSGYDRLESGQRLVSGVNTDFRNAVGQRLSVFAGQQYRMNDEAALPLGAGADTRFSDFVGRTIVQPHEWFGGSYRFQIDNRNRELLRSISGLSLGPSALRYGLSHARIDRSIQPTAARSINQLTQTLTARIDEVWRVTGRVIESLGADRGVLLAGATLIYEDDCFLWGVDFTRRNVGRADIPPDTALLFRFGFRNLGETVVRGF